MTPDLEIERAFPGPDGEPVLTCTLAQLEGIVDVSRDKSLRTTEFIDLLVVNTSIERHRFWSVGGLIPDYETSRRYGNDPQRMIGGEIVPGLCRLRRPRAAETVAETLTDPVARTVARRELFKKRKTDEDAARYIEAIAQLTVNDTDALAAESVDIFLAANGLHTRHKYARRAVRMMQNNSYKIRSLLRLGRDVSNIDRAADVRAAGQLADL